MAQFTRIEVAQAMKDTGSLAYTQTKAEEEADKAISALSIIPSSEYKDALIALAHIAANRNA